MKRWIKRLKEWWKHFMNIINTSWNKGKAVIDSMFRKKPTENSIEELKECIARIERFLCFQDDTSADLTEALKACYDQWMEMTRLQARNEACKAVLAAWVKKDGLSDLLRELREFAEKPLAIAPEKDACALSYNSQMFYLRNAMEKLKKQYSDSARPAARYEVSPENTARLIVQECGGVAAICDLPKALNVGRKLLNELQPDVPLTPEQRKVKGRVFDALNLLDSASDSTLQELEDIHGSILRRIQAMKRNIDQGTHLYKQLKSTLTDEWFDQFNPEAEACAIKGASPEEVCAFYRAQLEKLPEFLPDGEN